MKRRLGRAEAKARTRELLLVAAAQAFARKGFAGASVEEIAETAGFSVGALYSNFSSKEDLFLELSIMYDVDRVAEAAESFEHADLADSDMALLRMEFWLYAARNPEFREAIAPRMRESRAALRRVVATTLDQQRTGPEATPDAVSTVVAALFEGMPGLEHVPDDLFGTVLRWLYAGIEAVAPDTPPTPAAG